MPYRSPTFLQAVIDHCFDGISLIDMDGCYIFVNRRFCQMTGYGEDALLGMKVEMLLDPVPPSGAAAQSGAETSERTLVRKDGIRLPIEMSRSRIRVDDSDYLIDISRDISERRHAVASLEHQRERLGLMLQRLEVLLQVSKEINAELDVTAVLRHLVEAALQLTGAELGGAGLMEGGELRFSEYYRGKDLKSIDLRYREGQGAPGWVVQHRRPYLSNDAEHDPQITPEVREQLGFSNLLIIPIINRHGDLLGCFTILDKPEGFDEMDVGLLQGLSAHAAVALENAQIIRDRHQAFRALELSEQKYRSLIENASDAIFLANADTGILFDANYQAEQLVGLPREKIVGMHQSELHPPEDAERYMEYVSGREGADESRLFREMSVLRHDGEVIPVEIGATVIHIGDRRIVQSVFRDISERKRAEAELKQLNRTLKLISECNQILVRAKGEQELLNDVCQQIVDIGGYRMAWVGIALRDEEKHIRPVAQAGFEEDYLESISITWRKADVYGRGPTGRAIRTGEAVICQDIEHDPDYVPWHNDACRRGYRSAAAFPLLIGEETIGALNIYDSEPYAFHGEEIALLQELAADLAYGVDAHRHREAKARLEAQLLQSQKMEAVGTLAGGIAHDFNNILTGMLGNLYLAKRDSGDRPNVLERLRRVEAQGHRAAETVAQLLTFARKGNVHMLPLSLSALIKEHMKLYRATIPENIELHTRVGEGNWTLNGDATQLQQMLLNLLANARHAVEERISPMIEVSLELVDADSNPLLRQADLEGEHFVHLLVHDNGCGIAEVHLEKIFEPFFTTKSTSKGTGLGLAMVYGIVQSHGGAIEVESREGEGTSVHIYLPLIESELDVDEEDEKALEAGQGETVLLVDDDDDVRQTIEAVLSSLGYRVLAASDGEAGWQLFEEHGNAISIAMLDVVMPRMSGPKLARKMRQVQPELPILFQSGYGEDKMLSNIQQMARTRLLLKPVQVSELSRTIRQMLQWSR
ncbi:MAG TPA: GAF domain-containing protein [Mariprofundaceae bacterium]|nr:GAF domain-containing protein [Mariprofundaceae bacterium]